MTNNAQSDGYPTRALNGLKRFGAVTWPLLILCVVNFATFSAQYNGHATFPWDFLGGYHAQSFGWYNEGGMLNPPSWFPWTNLGFPAFLALQSGAWYLPLQAMHALGIAYTIHAATVFQVLHVLFGAVGVYFLARRLGTSKAIALMVALGFHFSAAFYSNQQNVDIVRATAFIPWVLLVLYPSKRNGIRWNVLTGAFVLSQFLIAGYPGNIVATAYACIAWVAFLTWKEIPATRRAGYLVDIALIVLVGTLIAMLKWLPLILNGHAGITIEHVPAAPFAASHLLTLMTPYTTNILPSDITMRSLWLPLTCIWGAFYANPRNKLPQIGCLFMALALFMGIFVRSNTLLSSLLPGMQLSRFPLPDWRPIMHIGMIFVAIAGWTDFLTDRRHSARMLYGTVAAFAFGTLVILAAIRFGFNANELFRVIVANVILSIITLLYIAAHQELGNTKLAITTTTFALIAFTTIGGYQYQISQPGPWRATWNTNAMLQTFGVHVDSLIRSHQHMAATARRPRRMLLGDDVAQAIAQKSRSLYNSCWYRESYCVLGYDNLKMSVPYKMFLSALSTPDGDALLNFAKDPQQLLALRRDDSNVMAALAAVSTNDDAPVIGDARGIVVSFLGYAPSLVQYKISTPRDVQFVANEMWWPGWKVSVCTTSQRCSAYTDTRSSPQGLRMWNLDKGTWLVRLRYLGPSPVPGYICALLGLLLAIAALGIDALPGRSRAESATP